MAKLYIVFDTNAIYNPNHEDQFFAPEAARLIEDPAHAHLDLMWIIPRMVRLEREYAMRKKVKQIAALARNMPALFGETWVGDTQELHGRISQLAEAEMKRLNVQERKCEASFVDWNTLMDAAGSRLPPFDPNEDKEKGFKDAMVAETFIQIWGDLPAHGTDSIVLVTDDAVLSEHVNQRIRHNWKVLKNTDELSAELNFLASDIPTEIAEKLPARANEVLIGAGEFWDNVWRLSNANFPEHFSKAIPGLFNVTLRPQKFSQPSFVRKDMRRLYFTCRYSVYRVAQRLVPSGPYPEGLLTDQDLITVGHGLTGIDQIFPSAIQSDDATPGEAIPMPPVAQVLPRNGLFGLGPTIPTEASLRLVQYRLPFVSVGLTWSTEFDVKGKGKDVAITMSRPRLESLDSVEFVGSDVALN
ncbi:PIN domain-containing protein [Paraburkholderia sp. RL17-383-BIF-A]|uniref:PIN domain-containing protein n=1 Tax=Paraburkholderia sp. RL17-383-BIF-A TaxID=3031631 RepID=UPI0038B99C59